MGVIIEKYAPDYIEKIEKFKIFGRRTTLLEIIFRGINFRVELIFANWPNSRKLNPAKSKNSFS